MINNKKLERVSRAICSAARMHQGWKCPVCEQDMPDDYKHDKTNCTMWPQFRNEAIAAIDAVKGF